MILGRVSRTPSLRVQKWHNNQSTACWTYRCVFFSKKKKFTWKLMWKALFCLQLINCCPRMSPNGILIDGVYLQTIRVSWPHTEKWSSSVTLERTGNTILLVLVIFETITHNLIVLFGVTDFDDDPLIAFLILCALNFKCDSFSLGRTLVSLSNFFFPL